MDAKLSTSDMVEALLAGSHFPMEHAAKALEFQDLADAIKRKDGLQVWEVMCGHRCYRFVQYMENVHGVIISQDFAKDLRDPMGKLSVLSVINGK